MSRAIQWTPHLRPLFEPLESRLTFSAGPLPSGWDVVLIDSTLPDPAALTRALVPGGHVILYDGRSESASQVLGRVTDWAEQSRATVRSLSLLSHASAGRFALGNEWVTTSTLKQEAEAWRRLGGVMAEGANILLFGCNLADRHGAGRALINRIEKLAGASVFASNDATGRGGDWVLEAASRGARADASPAGPFDARRLAAWNGALAAPAGGELLVNETTADAQRTHLESSRAVAVDDNGNFIVVWSGLNQSGPGWNVYAQRYDPQGLRVGGEFRVNTSTAKDQLFAAVAVDADGDFVITWSGGGAGDTSGVFARRYNAAGTAQGAEFVVNTTLPDIQRHPSVAMDDGGNFVISWTSMNQDGGGGGIYARRYNSLGVAQGGEIWVNTVNFANDQDYSRVAMDANGNFVIAWSSVVQPRFGYGIVARRFSSVGAALGDEFVVNGTVAQDQQFPALAVSADGAFVVAWHTPGQDGSGRDVYARRYNGSGVAQGGEFRVNATTAGDQAYASAAMDDGGNFFITWQSQGQDGFGWGVYGREYTPSGAPSSAEFRVNATTTGDQQAASVAAAKGGVAVVAWSGTGPGDADGVFAQRYDFALPGVTVAPTSGLVTTEGGGTATFTVALNSPPTADVTIGISSSNTGEGTVSVATLVFTAANWNVPQTVTVTGVDDAVYDGDAAYTVTTAAATSADPDYNGLDAADVSVTNLDNDNSAPVVTTSGGSVNYTENGSPVVIDAGLTVSDLNHALLQGATIRISGNFRAGQDVLSFVDQNGIAGSYDAATGVLTLSGAATAAQYEAGLRSVTYSNSSDAPATLTRTVSFTVSDGVDNSNSPTRDVTVTAVNDAPALAISIPNKAAAEDSPFSFQFAAGTFTDPDGDVLGYTASRADGSPLPSWLSFDPSTRTFSGTPGNGDAGGVEVRVVATDGSGASASDAFSINVAAVNDAPTVITSGGALAYTENDPPAFVDPGLSVADLDNSTLEWATVSITGNYVRGEDRLSYAGGGGITARWNSTTGVLTLSGAATVADYRAALRAVTYTNLSDAPSTATRTVTFVVFDGEAASPAAARPVMVTAVNDAPVAVADRYDAPVSGMLVVKRADGVLDNDRDAEGDALAAVLVSGPSQGTLTLNPDGSFTYVPFDGAAGSDSFTYRAADGSGLTSEAVEVRLDLREMSPLPPAPPPPPPPPPSDPIDDGPGPGPVPEPPPPPPGPAPAPPDEPPPPPPPPYPAPSPTPQPGPMPVDPGPTPVPAPPDNPPADPPADPAGPDPSAPPAPDDPDPSVALPGGPEVVAAGEWQWQPDAALANQLNRLAEQISEGTQAEAIVARTATGATIVWVGYVLYSLRGGALLGTLLTSLPLWQWMDPLPILDASDAKLGNSRMKAAKRDKKAREDKEAAEEKERDQDGEGAESKPMELLSD